MLCARPCQLNVWLYITALAVVIVPGLVKGRISENMLSAEQEVLISVLVPLGSGFSPRALPCSCSHSESLSLGCHLVVAWDMCPWVPVCPFPAPSWFSLPCCSLPSPFLTSCNKYGVQRVLWHLNTGLFFSFLHHCKPHPNTL